MNPAELDWLSSVAVPMLAVRAETVMALNPAAGALFGDAVKACPLTLAALFPNSAETLAAFLRAAENDGASEVLHLRADLAGESRHIQIAARRLGPAAEVMWALTLIETCPPSCAVGETSPTSGRWVQLLPTILDQLPVALLIEDEDDVGVFANRGFTEIFEYALEEIAALDDWWIKLYPDPLVRESAKVEWAAKLATAPRGNGTISTSEFQIRTGGGRDKVLQSHSFRIGDYRVHSYVDVSQRHQLALDLRQLADTDALTGVLNRRSFFQQGRLLDRIGEPLAALLLDVDHFKQVNDRHGHAFGDEVLIEISARVRAALRPHDVLARIGGEEFAVLLPGVDRDRAVSVAERLRQVVESTPITRGTTGQIATVSIGGACASSAETSIEDLLLHADRALYVAKRAGRNCVRFAADAVGAP
ncbi:GGDEF domain-containing protein [Ancylobacter sp. SL191]|uniref:GGDEF domain-containing protein n=1 Tax=Ancylobacter sp. SL191 TaxID=2995166 RepID=UPI002270C8AA|nr:sensor domain-containing diguanylate cyclase [Ancylobacter sp. SL191]WAC26307.1 sensor domain-containing diguanylate cyclase [Ancylobacter sp. SL191]